MLDVATVRSWLNKGLTILDLVSQMTPVEIDDLIVEKARKLASSDAFLEVLTDGINLLLGLFDKGLSEADVAEIKAKFAELKGSIGQAG